MTIKFAHIPVLLNESINYLSPRPGQIFIDCTLGGGGHALKIAAIIGSQGKLIGIDQDEQAITAAQKTLQKFSNRIIFINDNFRHLTEILKKFKIAKVDGILLDLGVSSYQLENPDRGFSFRQDNHNLSAKLDMRMDINQNFSAYNIINEYSEKELSDLLFKLGEEPFSRSIARKIVQARQIKPIVTTNDLLDIIKSATPPKYRYSRQHGHYASKVFRAIRMEVNEELTVIKEVIPQAIAHLNPGGRLVIITFHSLEDRLVKHTFRDLANQENPPVKLLTKKAIKPTPEEISKNPKSESAKLRAIEKIN